MPKFKHSRLEQDIKSELSIAMRQLKDPRVQSVVSIVKLELSNDLSWCNIHISSANGIEATKEAVIGLTSASGFLKRELSSRLKMRRCPNLKFIEDDSIEYSAKINKMLKDVL
jgi:ribosome-binding factor A